MTALAQIGQCGDFSYSTDKGLITIVKYTGTGGTVVVPGTILGLPVTRIGKWAFSFSPKLTSICLPDGITSIGKAAFRYCINLAEVTIPNGVNIIEDDAFAGCWSLTHVTIPDTVTRIGSFVFEGCSNLKESIFSGDVPNSGKELVENTNKVNV